jgi:uncharacterized repeat protein (TIGR03803 family)
VDHFLSDLKITFCLYYLAHDFLGPTMQPLRRWVERILFGKKRSAQRPTRSKRPILRLELLEDRITPTAPTVMLTSPAAGAVTNNNEPTLTATASESGGSGLASVQFQYSNNGGTTWLNAGLAESSAPFSFTFPSPLPDGTYSFRAIATDNAGNSTVADSGASYAVRTLGVFSGSSPNPHGNLIEDSGGNLFGTTSGSGAYGDGTVFEVAAGSHVVTTLASFDGANGNTPNGGLIEDSGGNLFGVTATGGAFGDGTVFEVASGSGVITTLASFNGGNGSSPSGSLVEDGSGNLFGAATQGGDGSIFEVAAGSSSITTIASFNGKNGATPNGGLIEDNSGDLFGTTAAGGPQGGGLTELETPSGYGTVFEIVHGSGVVTTLASFDIGNGAYPIGGLVEDSSGDLFGATAAGGSSGPGGVALPPFGGAPGPGTVFELAHGSSVITTLASSGGIDLAPYDSLVEDSSGDLFGGDGGGVLELVHGSDVVTNLGEGTTANMFVDSSGNLFGTTSTGGASGDGTVFEIAAGSHAYTTLASFASSNAGYLPTAGLLEDSNGNLFGTAQYGGAYGAGMVYEIAAGSNVVTTLASFNGDNPNGGLVENSSGDLFGALFDGAIFELVKGSDVITTIPVPSNFSDLALFADNSGNIFVESGEGAIFEIAAGSDVVATLADIPNDPGLSGNLVEDANGDLFGTTTWNSYFGQGYGTVFELPHGSSVATTLATFDNTNGAYPIGLVADSSGDLFGVTASGANGVGTVFEIAQGSGVITTLASFDMQFSYYGSGSAGRLVLDSNGDLFGVMPESNSVFELVRGTAVITTIATVGSADGDATPSSLISNGSGGFFGTTTASGAYGSGTVFELVSSTSITIDTAPPTVIIGPPSARVTAEAPVSYAVTIADPYFNPSTTLTAGDFTLDSTGTATGTISVTGSGNNWTVTINNVSGVGTLGVTLNAGSITDLAGNTNAVTTSGTFNAVGYYLAADFPGQGVFRYDSVDGWASLHTVVDATSVAVDNFGDVVAAFGKSGVYFYNGVAWKRIANAPASQVGIAGAGIIVGEFPAFGVYRYENGAWQRLTLANANSIAVDANGDVVGAFGKLGVYLYEGTTWTKIANASASLVAIDNGVVAAEFPGYGLYRYRGPENVATIDVLVPGEPPPPPPPPVGWVQLSTNNANSIGIDAAGDVVAAFGNGAYFYNSTSSTPQNETTLYCSIVGISSNGTVVINILGAGVYLAPFLSPIDTNAALLSISE